VLVGKLANVAVDRAIREVDFGVSLEITHLSLAIRVECRKETETATVRGESTYNPPRR